MGNVAIIDYGSGNLRSAAKAFERAVVDSGHPAQVVVTADPDTVRRADRVVLPGVGAFADCRRGLDAVPGLLEALAEAVITGGRPFLGICVGMQLMATLGHEHGEHAGLDWIAGTVEPLRPEGPGLKVPHMGWNELRPCIGCGLRPRYAVHPVLAGLPDAPHAYFVHSYQFQPVNPAHRLAEVDYGGPITAMIGRDTLVGTQFHPEKSQGVGLALIANFLRWAP